MSQVAQLLHIDDDDDDRMLFSRAFEMSGLEGVLHGVASASEALLYLNQLGSFKGAPRPHLIILDLSMPRLDGREFLALLKGNPLFRNIPVIVLTGSQTYSDVQRSRDLGVTDYIVKPRTHQELIEMIASFNYWLSASPSGIRT